MAKNTKRAKIAISISVLPESGCQFRFIPFTFIGDESDRPDVEHTLWELSGSTCRYSDETRGESELPFYDENGNSRYSLLGGLFQGIHNMDWKTFQEQTKKLPPYIRVRITEKQAFSLNFHQPVPVIGQEFAIETTCEQGHPGYLLRKTPVTEADTEIQKCIDEHAGTWIASQLPPSPYNNMVFGSKNAQEIELFSANDGNQEYIFTLQIAIRKPENIEPTPVHLAIDFGNTRTVALLFQENSKSDMMNVGTLRDNFTPVMLKLSPECAITYEMQRDPDNGIINSRMLLHEPIFSSFDEERSPHRLIYKKYIRSKEPVSKGFLRGKKWIVDSCEEYIPNMFVRYSPVCFGDEASKYLQDATIQKILEKINLAEQSSPKHYFWDHSKSSIKWSMIPRDTKSFNPEVDLSLVQSPMMYWINEDGTFFDNMGNFDPTRRPCAASEMANYPRSVTLLWFVVSILERAWEQCNSFNVDKSTHIQYNLKSLIVTYPAGWSNAEIKLYRELFQQALTIFEESTMGTTGRIELAVDIDEAVASQQPFIFSELASMKDLNVEDSEYPLESWLKMVGKKRNKEYSARIMNFDIGGGTTDIAIIDYAQNTSYSAFAQVDPTLLYRNGFNLAGDDIVKMVIKDAVFAIIAANRSADIPEEDFLNNIKHLFSDPGTSTQRARILRNCLLPIAIEIIKVLAHSQGNTVEIDAAGITEDAWNSFIEFSREHGIDGVPNLEDLRRNLEFSREQLEKHIHELFSNMLETCAKAAVKYDIDVFFISGKPSEIKAINDLIRKKIPLPAQRIITAKNYRAGSWYPFVDQTTETIKDAKTVTVVGAAMNHLLQKGRIDGLKFSKTKYANKDRWQWGRKMVPRRDKGVLKFQGNGDAISSEIDMTIGQTISRRLDDLTEANCSYRLQPKGWDKVDSKDEKSRIKAKYPLLMVSFKRIIDEDNERLELNQVRDDKSNEDLTDKFELVVCQCADESFVFWQDCGQVE